MPDFVRYKFSQFRSSTEPFRGYTQMPPTPTTLEKFRNELDEQIKEGQTHFEEQIYRVQKALFQFCSLIYDRVKETKFYENDQSHIRSADEIEYMSHLAVYYNA